MRSWIKAHPFAAALAGTLLAIACTATLDAVGLDGVNVLPLIPLFFLYWYVWRMSRAEIGLAWGRPRDYALAVFYPVLVIGLISVIAWLSGAVSTAHTNWNHAVTQLVTEIVFTIPGAIVTEEGIFRGWLWGALRRGGVSIVGVLVWTSLAFATWHVSTALLPTQYHPALVQVPVYIANAAVIGISWAVMRQWSGSIVVTSVSHAVWNGLGYAFFGAGMTVGALGIKNTAVFGPEIGLLGLGLNLAFAAVLFLAYMRGRAIEPVDAAQPAEGHA